MPDESEIIKAYEDSNLSLAKVGDKFGVSASTVQNILKKNHIVRRTLSEAQKVGAAKERSDLQRGKSSKDKTGERIGDLTITGLARMEELSYKKGSFKAIWSTRCTCGDTSREVTNTTWIAAKRERDNREKEGKPLSGFHCNSNPVHFVNAHIGERMGYLEVTGLPLNTGQAAQGLRNRERKLRDENWLVECICLAPGCVRHREDNPLYLTFRAWRRRKEDNPSKSNCGCLNPNLIHGMSASSKNADPKEQRIYIMFTSSKTRAKKDNVPHDIDPVWMKENLGTPDICPVLGIPIEWDNDSTNDNSPSLDKFYPDKGYVKGNVQIISYRANRIKNDGSPEEWLKVAEWCQKENVKRKLKGV